MDLFVAYYVYLDERIILLGIIPTIYKFYLHIYRYTAKLSLKRKMEKIKHELNELEI